MVTDGTACTGGLCTRGACLAPTTVSTDVKLSQTAISTGRTCAEGVTASVTAVTATTATLSAVPAAGCFAAGDEVLLINLQGTTAAHDNVGNWDLLTVASTSGTTVTFTTSKTMSFGSSAGSDVGIDTEQKVALVRIAQFGDLTVSGGKTITSAAWDGTSGGVVALRAAKLTLDGTISAAGLGYRDGQWSRDDDSCSDNVDTQPGESIDGVGTPGTANNIGGPGGDSAATNTSFTTNMPMNAGAGHATAGEAGLNGNGRTVGTPGTTYGVNNATRLTMGSGGSGSLTCANGFAGPALVTIDEQLAGGIVLLFTQQLTVNAGGAITASAKTADRDLSASGGYVFIRGATLSLGTGQVTAVGGAAPSGSGPTAGMSVKSGDGYVVVNGTTVTGTTNPAANKL
jgi:hypothetical protein